MAEWLETGDFNVLNFDSIDQIFSPRDTPFAPTITPKLLENGGGLVEKYGIRFNQGYVFNVMNEDDVDKDISKVDNMTGEFELDVGHPPVEFAVKIVLETDNLNIIENTFVSGEFGFVNDSGWDYPHMFFYEDAKGTELRPEAFTGYIPVCVLKNGDLAAHTCRENIFFGQRQIGVYGEKQDCNGGEGGEARLIVKDLLGIPVFNNPEWPIQFRSIVGGNNVCVTELPTSIIIDAVGDVVLTGLNTGTCSYDAEVYVEASDDPMLFRRLMADDDGPMTITQQNEPQSCIVFDSSDCVNIGNCNNGYEVHNEASMKPFEFRRLVTGDNITLSYTHGDETTDSNCIEIASSNCENQGCCSPSVEVYNEDSTKPFRFRRLTNGNNITLSYSAGDGTSDDNCIKIEGAAGTYAGNNRGNGEPVYVANTAAEYKTLKAYDGSDCKGGIILSSDDNEITISGSAPWTGENLGVGAANVFVHATGPQFCSNAQFRTITGRTLNAPFQPIVPQINAEVDGNFVRIFGNEKNGSLTIPKNINLNCGGGSSNSNSCGTLEAPYNLMLAWHDGLITGIYDSESDSWVTDAAQTVSNS